MSVVGSLPLPPKSAYSAPATAANQRILDSEVSTALPAYAWLPSASETIPSSSGRSRMWKESHPLSTASPSAMGAAMAPSRSATQYADLLLSGAGERRPITVPAAVEFAAGGGLANLLIGPILQCLEAATLGQPFEVWKTYMGRNRTVGTLQAVQEIYGRGGVAGFWAGISPKMVESGSKGAILMVAKEHINTTMLAAGSSPTMAGVLAGAGGGLCQVSIMGPCTYLVTGAVTGDRSMSTTQRIQRTWATNGFKGFYPGGTAIAFRQMTNWASRQGFTEFIRHEAKVALHGSAGARLSKGEEIGCGVLGGALACWNHPFEVARIEAQARADQQQSSLSMPKVMSMIMKEQGIGGLFKGIVPRVCLGIWQTLFMVTGAKLVKDALAPAEE